MGERAVGARRTMPLLLLLRWLATWRMMALCMMKM
jgi:hypothetical protein